MPRKTLTAVIALILMSSVTLAWDVEWIRYNTTSNELVIDFSFSPFEFLYAFFIGGGEYTKALAEDIISGNYTIVEAGYSSVKIELNGNITFLHPVNIYIENGNESYYITNATNFSLSQMS